MSNFKELSPMQREELLRVLKNRFEGNNKRHAGLLWPDVQAKLLANPHKLWSLNEMEQTGGEPDVTGYDKQKDEFIFCDCSPESPKGRRSICYDREALDSRKENKPWNNATEMAQSMGIELLTEEQYRALQKLEKFDTKTSSWVKTLRRSGKQEVLYSAIAGMIMYSYITMALIHIMLPGDLEVCSGCDYCYRTLYQFPSQFYS